MIGQLSQFAYIIQVALVFAAWSLVPLQQASQISSVWLTDHNHHQNDQHQPNYPQASNDTQTYNHQKRLPSAIKPTKTIQTTTSQSQTYMLKQQPRPAQTQLHQNGDPVKTDFISISAGHYQEGADNQFQAASSFKPTIVDLDSGGAGNVEQTEKTKTSYQNIKRSDQFNNHNISNKTINDDPTILSLSSSNHNEIIQSSPFESAYETVPDIELHPNNHRLGGAGGNDSLNQQVHFDEEQHQNLNNWGSHNNNSSLSFKNHRPRHRYNTDRNQSAASTNDQHLDPFVTLNYLNEQQQPDYQTTTRIPPQAASFLDNINNDNYDINHPFNQQEQNSSSHNNHQPRNNHGNHMIQQTANLDQQQPLSVTSTAGSNPFNDLNSNYMETSTGNHNDMISGRLRHHHHQRPNLGGGSSSSIGKHATLLRFSPADHSSWSLTPTIATTNSPPPLTSTTPTTTTTSVTTTTERPPFIYFSPEGDKWNNHQDSSSSARQLPANDEIAIDNHQHRKSSAMALMNGDYLNDDNRSQYFYQTSGSDKPTHNNNQQVIQHHGLTRFNHQRPNHNYYWFGEAPTSGKRYDNNEPSYHRSTSMLDRSSPEEWALLKYRQAQALKRLRNQALLLQLKRNQQLGTFSAATRSGSGPFYPARRPPSFDAYDGLETSSNFYQQTHNNDNRRRFLGALSQKLALPIQLTRPSQQSPEYTFAEDPKSTLENYFYDSRPDNPSQSKLIARPSRVSSLAKLRPIGSVTAASFNRYHQPYATTFPQHSLASFGNPLLTPALIRQQTIPRAPIRNYRGSGGDRYLASGSYDQASFMDASGLSDHERQAAVAAATAAYTSQGLQTSKQIGANLHPHGGGPAFIPVVAVTVTKTSPAPAKQPSPYNNQEQESSSSNSNESQGSIIEDYIERKTRQNNHQQDKRQQNQFRYHQNDQNEFGNSAQGSSQSQRQQADTGSVDSIGTRSTPSSSSRNSIEHQYANNNDPRYPANQLTTVKSAVFGYLPNQLPPIDPLLTNLFANSAANSNPKQQQPQQTIADQFYQPPVDSGAANANILPLSLQLQTNSLVQNDIAHPFGPVIGNPEAASSPSGYMIDHQHPYEAAAAAPTAAYASLNVPRNAQIPQPLRHPSANSAYLKYTNPLLPGDLGDQHVNHQAANQQLFAVAASELNPLAAGANAFMVPGQVGGGMLAANPAHWFYDATSSRAYLHPQQQAAAEGGPAESSNVVQSTMSAGSNINPPSKGKKRSSEFFASAGQLLLSALPLLLAPTLGLMFASMPQLPNIARHQNLVFPQQAVGSNVLHSGIPANYLNSLSGGSSSSSSSSGHVSSGGGTVSLFTPSPPLYSAPANPYDQYNTQRVPNNSNKPTRSPQQKSNPSINNRFLNSTGVDIATLMSGPNKPAAIVVTTSTTSSPRYNNGNYTDSYGNNSTTTTTRQTIAAVDNLHVLSNQTVVFIPSTDFKPPNNHNESDQSDHPNSNNNNNNNNNHYYQQTMMAGNESPIGHAIGAVSEQDMMLGSSSSTDSTSGSDSIRQNWPQSANQPIDAGPSMQHNEPTSHQHVSLLAHEKNHHHQPSDLQLSKRRHHYDLVPTSTGANGGNGGTTISYLEGADFDTQYANLPNASMSNYRQESSSNQPLETQTVRNESSIVSTIVDSLIRSPEPAEDTYTNKLISNKLETNNTTDSSTSHHSNGGLFPLTTWPTLRRKTVYLVTSQGNKTYSDSSDRYRDPNGVVSNEFIIEHRQVTKRPNSRLFKRILQKRETVDSSELDDYKRSATTTNTTPTPADEFERQEARRSHIIGGDFLAASIDQQSFSKNSSMTGKTHGKTMEPEVSSLADLAEETRLLRDEMLERKIQFDKIASSGIGLNDQPQLQKETKLDSAIISDDEPRQELLTGSRGQIIIPTNLTTDQASLGSASNNKIKHQQVELLNGEMSATQAIGNLMGDLMLKNQNEIFERNAIEAEVKEDTDVSMNPDSTMTADDNGSIEPDFIRMGRQQQISQPTNGNRHRSSDFSRQVRYSNQVGGPNLSGSANIGGAAATHANNGESHRGEDFAIGNNLYNQQEAGSMPYNNNNQQQQQQQQWGLRDTDYSRNSASTTNYNRTNQMRPISSAGDYGIDHNGPRTRRRQVPENIGTTSVSSYSTGGGGATSDFRPSSLNVPHISASADDYYPPNNYHRQPYNNSSSSSYNMGQPTRSSSYPSRNYYNHQPTNAGVSYGYNAPMGPPPAPPMYGNQQYNQAPYGGYNNSHHNHYHHQPQHSSYANSYAPNHQNSYISNVNRYASGSSPPEDYQPYRQSPVDHRYHGGGGGHPPSYHYQPPMGRSSRNDHQPNYNSNHNYQPGGDYYRVPVPSEHQNYDIPPPPPPSSLYPPPMTHHQQSLPPPSPPSRSIGPYGLMDDRGQQQTGHFAAGSMLAHQAGPLASLAANNSNDSGTVNEYLKQVHFSDSDRDKLMASYLTCDGLLNDHDHCLERLSCEFSDPLNIEKANKLDRAVSSILLGHILINTYIPNAFKHRLKAASLFGYKHSGKCSQYVCNKLIKQQQQSNSNSSGSSNSHIGTNDANINVQTSPPND